MSGKRSSCFLHVTRFYYFVSESTKSFYFRITNQNYPIYDPTSLYNTNERFDYGGFRQLLEAELTSSSSTLFSYRFSDPGVYAFYHSGDKTKKFFVRGLQTK